MRAQGDTSIVRVASPQTRRRAQPLRADHPARPRRAKRTTANWEWNEFAAFLIRCCVAVRHSRKSRRSPLSLRKATIARSGLACTVRRCAQHTCDPRSGEDGWVSAKPPCGTDPAGAVHSDLCLSAFTEHCTACVRVPFPAKVGRAFIVLTQYARRSSRFRRRSVRFAAGSATRPHPASPARPLPARRSRGLRRSRPARA